LPAVLYWCETLSLTLRKEHRLREFENRMLRRTFRRKRVEILGEWRKMHIEELRNLYSSPNIIRMIKSRTRLAGYVACFREKRNAYEVFLWKNQKERNYKEGQNIDGNIILNWILDKYDGAV
jgi:hypothetical protein